MKYSSLGFSANVLTLPAAIARRRQLRWFNSFISRAYRMHLTPWLESRLADRLGDPTLKVKPRHSVHQEDRFNVFESDLDLSILLQGSDEKFLENLKRLYLSWRKFLPFLGEVEIHEPWEWNQRQQLLEEYPRLLRTFWSLRKWVWAEDKWRCSTTHYHQRKALRSAFWIRQDLGLKPGHTWPAPSECRKIGKAVVSAVIADWDAVSELSPLSSLQGFARRSDYLGWILREGSGGETAQPFCLEMAENELFLLLAILPDGHWIWPEGANELARCRKHPAIARLHGALCLNEYLIFQSVKRTSDAPPDEAQLRWESFLLETLQQIGHRPSFDLAPKPSAADP